MIINEIFEKLDEKDIKYCHWKSIDRLEEVFNGETDIDILVNRKDAEKFIEIIYQFGAKAVLPRNWMIYPNMEDFLLYDKKINKIYHFHVHYKLVMGKKNLKEYILNIEKYYIENRVFNKEYKTYIVNPNIDLIILILREIQKIGIKTHIKTIFKKIDFKRKKEIQYLLEKIDIQEFDNYLKEIDDLLNLNSKLIFYINKIRNNNYIISFYDVFKIKKLLKPFKIYSNFEIFALKYIRRIGNNLAALISRNNAKHFRKGGLGLALVGADGSGKTTVADQLVKKLRYKLSAKKYYLGCNKRSYSIIARTIVFISYFFRGFKKIGNITLFQNIHLFGVLLAEYACLYDRKKLYDKAQKDIAKGMIIIFERFPLKNTIDYPICFINSFNFNVNSKYKFISKFEQFLQNEYNKIKIPEDYTFWINAPVELIKSRRKMDTKTIQKVEKKYNLVQQFALNNNLIILDAHKSVDELVADIMEEIFKI